MLVGWASGLAHALGLLVQLREKPVAGTTALAEVGFWMLELLLCEGGTPRPWGLTFFWVATSSRREVNVRRTARRARPQAE